jgi:hypothetical protein
VLMKYALWLRWYKSDMILLWHYTWGWLFKYGKRPYCYIVILTSLWALTIATLIWLMCPIYPNKPPVFSDWFIGRLHYFMRTGVILWERNHGKNIFICSPTFKAPAIRICEKISGIISRRGEILSKVQSLRNRN